ncbi:MAG: hypothetical protein EZS28_024783 [Streblomastix strix]|uniref:Uncharacterized protein n=1 Tax=Streblomastix strix TaxID=222440 RepID=A0A5J4VAZ9_9EUKA|nr:MAG: hypothetical protein EZS28_024783 [Streblomastix strix]
MQLFQGDLYQEEEQELLSLLFRIQQLMVEKRHDGNGTKFKGEMKRYNEALGGIYGVDYSSSSSMERCLLDNIQLNAERQTIISLTSVINKI